ncbi:hypothetical protein CGLAMM_03905 [Acetobacteraceae bacterium EV16G]|uniref:N-acetyltransferase domain-containing protein n=1 Tax=Sorlinia euscelidii TaxID=3081148 RepID=A0ABU7U101_9PROT
MTAASEIPPVIALTVDETLPPRQAVLWPSLSLDECRVEGDAEARHYGMKIDGEVICCFSIFDIGNHGVRLRKFATTAAHQRKGYGGYLLAHVMRLLQAEQVAAVVLDARLTAAPFYEKHGFAAITEIFKKSGVAHVRMERRLT